MVALNFYNLQWRGYSYFFLSERITGRVLGRVEILVKMRQICRPLQVLTCKNCPERSDEKTIGQKHHTSHPHRTPATSHTSHVTPTQNTGYESHVTRHTHNEAPGHTSRVTHIRLRVRIKNQYPDLGERKGHHNYCLRDNLKTLTSNVQSRLEDPGFGGWNAGERTVGHQLKKYQQDTISDNLSHDFPPRVDTQPPHSDNTDGLTLCKRF